MNDQVKHKHNLSELPLKQNDEIWYVDSEDSIYTWDKGFHSYIIRDAKEFSEDIQHDIERKKFTGTMVKLHNTICETDMSLDQILKQSMKESSDWINKVLDIPRYLDDVDEDEGELD
jgi:hypothetical protein